MKSSGWMSTDARNFVVCPKCGASKGENCKTPKDRVVTYVHGERESALVKLPIFNIKNYQRGE